MTRSTSRILLLLTGLVFPVLGAGPLAAAEPAPPPVFEKDVLPLFQAKCARCHGSEQKKADLDVRSKAGLLKGGESGPALSPGSAERSELWIKIAADKMPPGKEKLTEAEKVLLRAWIDSGAKDDGTAAKLDETKDRQITDADRSFWSFRKPVRPSIPGVVGRDRVRNPIDAFILAALEKKGLTLSPEADRVTLLRRVCFDLTGLPPTPQEVETFLNDKSPDAYERLVDRLLASPHYGERWGRHWLDLAGYADSEGILDADYVRSAAWRYRDYVIRALNADKPYDRFLKEQLAGDELVDYWTAYRTGKELSPDVVEALVATGYLRCASDTSRPDFANIKNAPGYYYQTLDDTVKIVSSSMLGLTVQCARCHSHKYDPIPQTDYYRLQAVFMSGYRPAQWVPQVQRRLLEATESQEKEAKEHNARLDAVLADLRKQRDESRHQFVARLLADRLTAAAAFPEARARDDALAVAATAEEGKRRTFPEIRAFYDLPGEAKTPLLRRGDYLNPGQEVTPGALSVVDTARPFTWTPPAKDSPTSGRRLAFAEWLTQPDHPLTARVAVNHLWLHHFGEGLVSTADNFGHTGSPPSHPELLDWLATEFTARGWSLKAVHRLILTSATYRQASALDPVAHAAARKADPDDRLLWRQRLRRLEAEALRDGLLRVGGSLNPQMYGSPVGVQRQGDGEVVTAPDAAGSRRSVYLQVRRSQPVTLLQVFDQPVLETNCTRRATSTVSSQALTLLNSDFVVRQGEGLAARALRENAADPAAYAVQVAFGRPATEKERARLGRFVEEQTSRHLQAVPGQSQEARRRAVADLCQMLLSANEFAYVD